MNAQLPYFDTATEEKKFLLWLAKNAPSDWNPFQDDIVCLLKSNDEFRLRMQDAYPKVMIAMEFDADDKTNRMLRREFDEDDN